MNGATYDLQAKVLMVGDTNVGKTWLRLRYVKGCVPASTTTTIGVDFQSRHILVDDKRVKLQIWDTAGGERFRSLIPSYLRGTHGILLIYDVTNHETFESIRYWMQQIQQYAGVHASTILVGTKCDQSDGKVVTTQEGQALANEFGITFWECSAKNGIHVDEPFQDLARAIKNRLVANGDQQLSLKKANSNTVKNTAKIYASPSSKTTTSQAGHDLQVKLLMIGDSNVGKTCLLVRYTDDSFSPIFVSTIGIDFKTKNIQVDGTRVRLQIWDTAGQERFRSITLSYFRGSHGIMLVYDVTDRRSFELIRNWIQQIQQHADVHVNLILVGNKCDKLDEKVVTTQEGQALANEIGIPFWECSAKNNINVEEAFQDMARAVKDRLVADGDGGPITSKRIKLKKAKANITRKRCC